MLNAEIHSQPVTGRALLNCSTHKTSKMVIQDIMICESRRPYFNSQQLARYLPHSLMDLVGARLAWSSQLASPPATRRLNLDPVNTVHCRLFLLPTAGLGDHKIQLATPGKHKCIRTGSSTTAPHLALCTQLSWHSALHKAIKNKLKVQGVSKTFLGRCVNVEDELRKGEADMRLLT